MNPKSELRQKVKTVRDSLDSQYRQTAESSIFQKLTQLPELANAKTIAVYASYQPEVDTHSLISHWLSLKQRVVVPKIVNNEISFFEILDLNELSPGYKGVPEPSGTTSVVNPATIDVCVVPGLAFDVSGYRLGYGKGFYDRFLATYTHLSIGICFTNQLFYEIPHDMSDIPVNVIITDTVSIPYTSSTASHLPKIGYDGIWK